MPLDTRIALSAQPYQAPDLINMAQNALAVRGAMEKQRTSNFLNQAYAQSYNPQTGEVDYNTLARTVAQSPYASALPQIMEDVQNKQKTAAEIAQKGALQSAEEARAAQYGAETKQKQLESALKTSYANLQNVSTPDELMAWHEANHKNPAISEWYAASGLNKEDSTAKLQAGLAESGGFEKQVANSKKALETMLGVKPEKSETQVVELGGRKKLVNTQTGDVIKDLGSAATAASQDDSNTVAFRETAEDGTVTMFNKYGQVIGTTKGKKSATYAKTETAQKQLSKDLDSTIAELTEAVKPGGLIEQSTGSGIGRAVDVGANIFGATTSGQLAIASLQPIYDKVLKMVPRFEGPQSDKDTQSYREAAGQLANPSLPNKVKLAAANTILRLMKARKNQFTTQEATDAGVVTGAGANVRSQADAIISGSKK